MDMGPWYIFIGGIVAIAVIDLAKHIYREIRKGKG